MPKDEIVTQNDDAASSPHVQVHPKIYDTVQQLNYEKVNNKLIPDDKPVNIHAHTKVTTEHDGDDGENNNELTITENRKCENVYNKTFIANVTRNSVNVKEKRAISDINTIFLAGYDDQIYNLMYDIQKQGLGCELLVYFYLYTNNNYRNIGYFYTNKAIFYDCIQKYTHYFCLNFNNSGDSCLKSLGEINRNVKIGPEAAEQQIANVDGTNSIIYKKINTEPEHNRFNNIYSAIRDPKTYYPVKKASGAYEFTLPKQSDINFKDIYIDILKSKGPNHMERNKKSKDPNNLNYAQLTSNKEKTDSQLDREDLFYLEDRPINIEPATKTLDDTYGSIDSLNFDKAIDDNNAIFEVPDQTKNQECTVDSNLRDINLSNTNKTDSVLQLEPCHHKGSDQNYLNNSEIQIPHVVHENIGSHNMITLSNDNLTELSDQVTLPDVLKEENFAYAMNIPEYRNTLKNSNISNQPVDNKNVNGRKIILNSVPINRVKEISPNIENLNFINDATSPKHKNDNIILNCAPKIDSNKISQIKGEDIAKDITGVETKTIDNQESCDKSNAITADKITLLTPLAPLDQSPDRLQAIVTPNINTHQISQGLDTIYTLEPTDPKTSQTVSYLITNPNIMRESKTPRPVTQVSDLNAIPNANVKSQPPFNLTDNSVVENCNSIPNIDTEVKEVPQTEKSNYHDRYNIFSIPCNNMNNLLFDTKKHSHVLPSSYLQYVDMPNNNQPILAYVDKNHNLLVNSNIVQTFPGDIRFCDIGQYDPYSDKRHNNPNNNLYTILDPLIYQLTPDPRNNKNIIKYLNHDSSEKPESILDLTKSNLDNDTYSQDLPTTKSQFRDDNLLNVVDDQKKCETDQKQITMNIPGKDVDNVLNYYNKSICPFKYNSTESAQYYPYYREKLYYKPIIETKDSNTYYIPDPCTYKNIVTMENNLNAHTPDFIQNNIHTGDTPLVNDYLSQSHKHIDEEIVSNNNYFPTASLLRRLPISQHFNSYLNNMPLIKDNTYPFTKTLTPFEPKPDISHKDLYTDLATIKPALISKYANPRLVNYPIYQDTNEILRSEEQQTLPINFDNNTPYMPEIASITEPITKNYNIKLGTPEYLNATFPLRHWNSLPTLYYSLLNNNPPTKNHYCSYTTNLQSALSQKFYSKPGQTSEIKLLQDHSKTGTLSQNSPVTELLNNVNCIQNNLNPVLHQSVPPTILKPHNVNIVSLLHKSTFPTLTDSSSYTLPPSSVPLLQKSAYCPISSTPPQDKKMTSHTTLPPQLTAKSLYYLPVLGIDKQNLHQMPQPGLESRLNDKRYNTGKDNPNSDSQSIYFSNLKPPDVTNTINDQSVVTSPVHLQAPLFSDAASCTPISAFEALHQSKQSKTIPSVIQDGKYTSGFSGSIKPLQPLLHAALPLNYVSLPNTIKSSRPNHFLFKVPFKTPMPQNIVTYIDPVPAYKTKAYPLNLNPISLHADPLNLKYTPYSPYDNKYTKFPKQNPLPAQSSITNITPNKNLENLSGAIAGYQGLPKTTLKPSAYSPNYVKSSDFNSNINSWLLANNIQPGNNKNTIETITPSKNIPKESVTQGNADVLLTNSVISPFAPSIDNPIWSSSVPMQYLSATNINPSVLTQFSITEPSLVPSLVNNKKPTYLQQTANKNYLNAALSPLTMTMQPTISTNSNLEGTCVYTNNNLLKQMKSIKSNFVSPVFLSKNSNRDFKAITPDDPLSYSKCKATYIPASSNKITKPSDISHRALVVASDFDKFVTPLNELKYLSNTQPFVQKVEPVTNKVTKIPVYQESSSDFAVSPSLDISPDNFSFISKPYDVISNPADMLPVTTSTLGLHSHVSTSLNSAQNKYNTVWSYKEVPYSTVSNNFNLAIPPSQNALTNIPESGKMPLNPVAYANVIPTSGSGTWSYLSRPLIQTQKDNKKPIDSFGIIDQSKQTVSINDMNMEDINYSNVFSDTYQSISSSPLAQSLSYFHPKSNYAVLWSNMGNDKKLKTFQPISNANLIHSDSIPLPRKVDFSTSSISSPLRSPYSLPSTYASGGHTDKLISSVCYTPYNTLAGKSLRPCVHKLDLKQFMTDPSVGTPTSLYSSSLLPKSIYSTFETKEQIKSDLPYYNGPTLKEVNCKSYQNLLSNNMNTKCVPSFIYDNNYQSNEITASPNAVNPPQVTYTNQPYIQTLAKYKNTHPQNINSINEINNNLKKYLKQSDLLPNIKGEKAIIIPLQNIAIKCDPKGLNEAYYIRTDNPDIDLKVWPTAAKLLKAKIVLEHDDVYALNFCPVVKFKSARYTKEAVRNIVVKFVNETYGKPIIVPNAHVHKSYALVDNIDKSFIKNNTIYIVWSNICDCGCNRLGCQCKNMKYY